MGHRLTTKPVPGDWNGTLNAIARLDTALNSSASPEFAGVTLSGLTANALMYADSDGVLTSLAAATDGQLVIGSTDAVPSVAALAGTANQIIVTNGAGSITLTTPQDIDATAIPTFAGLISTGVVRATDFAKTGWPTTQGVTLSFDNASKVFKVTDGGSAYYYIDGVKYTLGGDKTVDLDDVAGGAVEGLWYIYFVGATLTASQTLWSFKAEDKALVGLLYWDATNTKEIFLGWELHTFHMDGSTHARLHYAGGARWETGLLVTDAGGGTIDVSAGDIWDEDLNIPITDDDTPTALFEQILSPAQLPIYYRDGATAWRVYETNEKAATTDVGYLTGGNLQYNKLNGTWANATVTAPNHVAYWVVATNDQTAPIVLIMGQRVDLLIANAKENSIFGNLDLTGLPFEEMVVLARLILKDTGTYSLVEVLDLRAYNIKGNITSPLTSDHGGLAGLGDDDHVQYLLADGTRALAGAWDMDSQVLTNVNIDSGVITGITDLLVADGGTGASSLTEGGVLLGSGTDPITAMGVLADGEFIVGDGTTDPVAESGATVRTSLGLGTGDSPTFAALSLGTGELTCGSINRAADTLTLEIAGTPQISITSTTVTFAGAVNITGEVTLTDNIIIPDDGWIGSVTTNESIQIASTGNVTIPATLNVTGDVAVTGNISLTVNNGSIGYTDNSPMLVFNNTDDRVELTGAGGLAFTSATGIITQDTVDGSDNAVIQFCGGGVVGNSRGGYCNLFGNEHATSPGCVEFVAGNVTGGVIKFFTDNNQERVRIDKAGLTTLYGNLVIPDDGYIGSTSAVTAIQIETDGDLVCVKDITAVGELISGVADTTRGLCRLYGGASGYGGTLYLQTAGDADDDINQYMIATYQDDFVIADDTIGDIIKITGTAGRVDILTTLFVTNAITASNYTAANLLTACATSAGGLDFSSDVTLTVAETETTTNYHTDVRAATWLAANHETTYTHADIALNTTHRGLVAGNPHVVTPTELSLVIGTDTQAWDAELDSLAALSYVAASFVKMTGANTFVLRTIGETADDLEGTINHANLNNLTIAAHDTTATGANLTSLTDNSMTDTLHRHSELSASDGTPDAALSLDAAGDATFGGDILVPSGGTIFNPAGYGITFPAVASSFVNIGYRLAVNNPSPTSYLNLAVASSGQACYVAIEAFGNAQYEFGSLYMGHSRSDAIGTYTETQNGDYLGQITMRGVDTGGNSEVGFVILADQNGAAGVKVPTDAHMSTHSSTAENADQLVLYHDGNIGMGGVSAPTAKLHIDQASASGAKPVLRLDQGDVDDSFVDFIGTSAADGTRSISSDVTENSAKFGAIRVEINGVTKWIRIYDDES